MPVTSEFKVVVCIDVRKNKGDVKRLTEGKAYDVLWSYPRTVRVRNDAGFKEYYGIERFEIVPSDGSVLATGEME
jgi:hypothetical protein